MQNQEAATGNFEWNKLPSGRRVIHDFTPCTWGSRLYEVSGKRYTPSFLQGHPSSLRFGHPDVTTGDTAFLTLGHGLGAPCPSSAPAGNPSSLRFGHPDVTTGDTAFLTLGPGLGAPCPSSAPAGNPPSQSSGTLMSLPEGIATPAGP